MVFPDPLFPWQWHQKIKVLLKRWVLHLGKMVAEDPSFRVTTDEESGETILHGMGELHLDIKIDILKTNT